MFLQRNELECESALNNTHFTHCHLLALSLLTKTDWSRLLQLTVYAGNYAENAEG